MQPSGDIQDAPPIGSKQFWGNPFRYPVTGDPDTDTARTVAIMCDLIHQSARTPAVWQAAQDAVKQFSGLAGRGLSQQEVIACAVFWWFKHYCTFVHHELLIRRYIGEAGHLQGLISPEVFVQVKRPEGDCAIFAMCAAAFLEVFGIPWELVTVKVSRKEPREYSHVYLYAVLPDGRRMPIDASHGDVPGWQVPSRDVNWNENVTGSPALQVWDSAGNKTVDRSSRFSGLHNYSFRRRGIGDVCTPGDPDYDLNFCAAQTGGPATFPVTYPVGVTPCTCVQGTCLEDGNSCSSGSLVPPSGTPYSGPTFTAPNQNSAQWASFATALAKMGFQQAAINSIQPGTVVSANGAILRQATGLPVPVGSSLSTSLTTLGGGNILLYGGLLVGGVLLFSLLGSGRR